MLSLESFDLTKSQRKMCSDVKFHYIDISSSLKIMPTENFFGHKPLIIEIFLKLVAVLIVNLLISLY